MLESKAPAAERRRQRHVWVAVIAAVLIGHAALLGGLDAMPGAGTAATAPTLSVRTIVPVPPVDAAGAPTLPETTPAPPTAAAPAPPPPQPRPRPPRAAREPAPASAPVVAVAPQAVASAPSESFGQVASAASQPAPTPVPVEATMPVAAASAASATAGDAEASPPPLVAAGDTPPPVYRTQLPPPVTLRYEARRGFFRGTGEIRWRRDGDTYSLALEARIAGLTLLTWTSDGRIDAAGLAPDRFLDQRARRAAQAANFRRDSGKVTFSGSKAEWPLLPGSQDELSWMIQLAGIAAADPELLVEGGRITMVVVGARGDARVWTLRSAGRETVETASGPVSAVKLLRDNLGPYERGYEIWLDPQRSWVPAHVTQRNASGGAELDLLLERFEPAP